MSLRLTLITYLISRSLLIWKQRWNQTHASRRFCKLSKCIGICATRMEDHHLRSSFNSKYHYSNYISSQFIITPTGYNCIYDIQIFNTYLFYNTVAVSKGTNLWNTLGCFKVWLVKPAFPVYHTSVDPPKLMQTILSILRSKTSSASDRKG